MRKQRAAKGTPTDEEQDLLRAMVVFASSGLDAVVKQLIKDSLLALVEASEDVRAAFRSFVEKRLRGVSTGEGSVASFDPKFAAAALVAPDIKGHLVDALANELTAGSLQSVDELKRVAAFLGADPKTIAADQAALKDAFHARNQIIHEMDINSTK